MQNFGYQTKICRIRVSFKRKRYSQFFYSRVVNHDYLKRDVYWYIVLNLQLQISDALQPWPQANLAVKICDGCDVETLIFIVHPLN